MPTINSRTYNETVYNSGVGNTANPATAKATGETNPVTLSVGVTQLPNLSTVNAIGLDAEQFIQILIEPAISTSTGNGLEPRFEIGTLFMPNPAQASSRPQPATLDIPFTQKVNQALVESRPYISSLDIPFTSSPGVTTSTGNVLQPKLLININLSIDQSRATGTAENTEFRIPFTETVNQALTEAVMDGNLAFIPVYPRDTDLTSTITQDSDNTVNIKTGSNQTLSGDINK